MKTNNNYFKQESERLTFRKLTENDIPDWISFFINNDRLRFLGIDLAIPKAELAEKWIMSQLERYKNSGFGHLAVELKESNEFIGMCGIIIRELEGKKEYEIAYSLKPNFWKKGYGTEMAKQMKKFATLASASQVSVTLDSFAGLFNSGKVDIVVMPALAYNTFELYHGLGDNGGIIDKRLYYGMLQTIAKRDQFPEDFGHTMRNYVKTRLKAINKLVKDAEEEIPEKYWINISDTQKNHWNEKFRESRIALRDRGTYNAKALTLFRKVRCKVEPSLAECTSKNKE